MRITPGRGPTEVDLLDLAEQPASPAVAAMSDLLAADAGDPDDFGAFARPGVAAARPGARLDQRLEAEAQAVAVAGHGHRVHGRRGVGLASA